MSLFHHLSPNIQPKSGLKNIQRNHTYMSKCTKENSFAWNKMLFDIGIQLKQSTSNCKDYTYRAKKFFQSYD